MTNRHWILRLTLALVAVGLPAASASAQQGGAGGAGGSNSIPSQPDLEVVAPETAIPANGALLIYSGSSPPIVSVHAEGSAVVLGGTTKRVLQDSREYWAWTPSAPFVPGRYEVTLLDEFSGSATAAITAIDAIDLERMPAPLEPRVERLAFESETATCVRWRDARLEPASSFRATEGGRIEVKGGLDPEVAPELAHQFFFSVALADVHFQYTQDASVWGLPMHFQEQSERYCVSYRAVRLVDGEELATELCAPHGELAPLDAEAVDVPDSALERTACPGAPAGFEERWCAINRACDAFTQRAEIEANDCGLYGAVCRNECLPDGSSIGVVMFGAGGAGATTVPPWGGAGSSGSPHGPCTQAEANEPEPNGPQSDARDDIDEDDVVASMKNSGAGCGCSTLGSDDRSSYVWLAALATLAAICRVRRRRSQRI